MTARVIVPETSIVEKSPHCCAGTRFFTKFVHRACPGTHFHHIFSPRPIRSRPQRRSCTRL